MTFKQFCNPSTEENVDKYWGEFLQANQSEASKAGIPVEGVSEQYRSDISYGDYKSFKLEVEHAMQSSHQSLHPPIKWKVSLIEWVDTKNLDEDFFEEMEGQYIANL